MTAGIFLFFGQTAFADGDFKETAIGVTQSRQQRVDSRQAINDAKCALETLRSGIEEWGTLTVSEPMVIYDTGQFKLPGTFEDTSAYISRARDKVQGGAAQSSQSSVSNSLSIQVSPNYSLSPAGKKTPLDTGDSLKPGAPLNADVTPAALPTPPAPNFSTFSNPDSIAVPTGESAKITEMLGRTLANPAQQRFTNSDLTVHFAIVQVSCNPGWRTRENYVGDVTATCEFYDSKRRTFQSEDDPVRPLVFSVLPLLDAQTLELANNEQRITNLVTQIAAAYPTTVANLRASDLIKLTKQYQSSVATRSPRTVTNSYSAGSSFGFRFSPSLTALRNPAESRSGSANILQATSFPVLVTFIINQPHAAQFDSVLVHLAHHWLLNDRPPLRKFWKRWAMPLKRDRIEGNFDLADAAQRAHDAVFQLPEIHDGHIGLDTPATVQMLYRQYQELRIKATGSSHPVFSIPLSTRPRLARVENLSISEVTPRTVAGKSAVGMMIRGSNFLGEPSQFEVWLGQRKGEVLSLRHADQHGDQMFVEFPALAPDEPVPAGGELPLIVVGPRGMDSKPDAVVMTDTASKVHVSEQDETNKGTTGTASSRPAKLPRQGLPPISTPTRTSGSGRAPVTESHTPRAGNRLALFASVEASLEYDWDPTLPSLNPAPDSIPMTAQLENNQSDLPVP